MDPAVALVQAYLRVNGYFTVAEYPVLEATRRGGYRMATDLDLLAFRFPGAGRYVSGARGEDGSRERFVADPALGAPPDDPDMLIGEVKEGRAELNTATRNREVLRAALIRFGCCSPDAVGEAVGNVLDHGRTTLPNGHRVRIVAFGSRAGEATGAVDTVLSLGHVTGYLRAYLRDHWEALRHVQFKDPVLGFLAAVEKAES